MRLIDRIARPSPISQKRLLVQKYAQKLEELNYKMREVKKSEDREYESNLGKNKSQKTTRSKTAEHKKAARQLYTQYNEVNINFSVVTERRQF